MARIWHRFWGPLTSGVRIVLMLLALAYASVWIGKLSSAFSPGSWLALSGLTFWHGQVWRLLTYALIPGCVWDFLSNWMLIAVIGVYLQRVWSRSQFWAYCLVCATGTGLAKILVHSTSPIALVGTTPVVFGLLVAWARVFGHERAVFWMVWEASVRQVALVAGVVSFLIVVMALGLVNACIMLCGGVAGWAWLALRARQLHAQPSQSVTSERIGRLEL